MARPLRQQVIGIAGLLAIVVIGALQYASRVTYREQLQHLRQESLAMTTTVVAYLERNLAAADQVALAAARHPKVQTLRPEAASEVLVPLVSGDPMIRNAVIADRAGRAIAWATPPFESAEGGLSPSWLAGVARSGQPAVSPVLGDPEHTAHVVVTGYPIQDEAGAVVGVLALAVHLEWLENVFANIPLPPESVITVTDAASVVVARSLDSGRFVGRPASMASSVSMATSWSRAGRGWPASASPPRWLGTGLPRSIAATS